MSRVQIGVWGVVALVALRLGIGFHFFLEGSDKINNPKPFSALFFGNAKGPLAPLYKSMIWDADGLYRLDNNTTADYWAAYGDRVVAHYRFDEDQANKVTKAVEDYNGRLAAHLGEYEDDIFEYDKQLTRRDKNLKDPTRTALASLRAHDAKIEGERNKLKAKIIPGIDAIWKDLENELNGLATVEQFKAHGRLPIGKIGRRFMDTEMVDGVIRYFDFTIGVLLILGLFVRPAALLAAGFLLTVCLSQWPGTYGAIPIYYQGIEMLALLVLAAFSAGNLAGLDFFITAWRAGCYAPPKPVKASK